MSYKTQSYANTAASIIKNLEKRNMTGYYCETAAQARTWSDNLFQSRQPYQAAVLKPWKKPVL